MLFLILFMGAGICFADEYVETAADINNLFIEDAFAEEIVPIVDENEISVREKSLSEVEMPKKEEVVVASQEIYESSASEDYQIQGYLQYSEQPEPEFKKNAVYFDGSDMMSRINFSSPKKMTSKSLLGSKKPTFGPIQDEIRAVSKFSSQEYAINPVSTSYSKKLGKLTLGTVYDSSLDSASVSYTTSIFSKFEGKFFAFSTAFAKNTNLNDVAFSDKIYIIPELKITKRLSLLNVMQTDMDQINKKSEIVLRYTPHIKKYADDVQFEIGAGQTFYNEDYVKSSLRFSTKFKL